MRAIAAVGVLSAIVSLGAAAAEAEAAELPQLRYVARLGLFDAVHTRADGLQESWHGLAFGPGYLVGQSYRFSGMSERGAFGVSTWIAGPDGVTRQLGLLDAAHTRPDDTASHNPVAANSSGTVVGRSTRVTAGDPGEDSWVADAGGTTRRIGLYGPPGSQGSAMVTRLNEAGIAIGTSGMPGGDYAWVSRPDGQTVRIGFYDREHTLYPPDGSGGPGLHYSNVHALNAGGASVGTSARDQGGSTPWLATPDGVTAALEVGEYGQGPLAENIPSEINDAGMVTGFTMRWVPAANATGYHAWVRTPEGVVRRVGFYDGPYVDARGWSVSTVGGLTQSGYAIGLSEILAVQPWQRGGTAWVVNAAGETRRIGYYDAEHTWSDGFHSSTIFDINEAGQLMGISRRPDLPVTAWRGDATGNLMRIGLMSDDPGTWINNLPTRLTESGYVVGEADYALRNAGPLGQHVWVAETNGETLLVGLYDAAHVSSENTVRALVEGVTESGYTWGYNVRYEGRQTSESYGTSAWLYHIPSRTQHVIPVDPVFEPAATRVTHVSEDGVAFGNILPLTESGHVAGHLSFVFVPGQGITDLENVIDIAPAEAGWERFDAPVTQAGKHLYGVGPRVEHPESQAVYQMDLASEPRVESDLHLDLRQQVYRCGDRFGLVTYTVTVKNPGPGAATEVSVRNRLPDGALFYGAQATRGTLKTPKQWHQGTLTWTIGAVDANAGKVIQLRICAMLKGSGRHVNRARVVAATPDPDSENNAASTTYHWR